MRRSTAAWTQRFADAHLATTLRRRLADVGVRMAEVTIFPVLNSGLDPDAHSASHCNHQRDR